MQDGDACRMKVETQGKTHTQAALVTTIIHDTAFTSLNIITNASGRNKLFYINLLT